MTHINCLGALNIDLQGFSDETILAGDCNAGVIESSPGGVAGNIAAVLARLQVPVRLFSAVGDDAFGRELLEHAIALGIDTSFVRIRRDQATSTYLNVVDADGSFVFGISDMKTIERILPDEVVLPEAEYTVIDACLSEQTLAQAVRLPGKIYLDPVSAGKTRKISPLLDHLYGLKLNQLEAQYLTGIVPEDEASQLQCTEALLRRGVQEVILTLGEQGVLYRDRTQTLRLPALKTTAVNPSGAGDSFFAGYLAMKARGYNTQTCLRVALICATMSVESKTTISSRISWETIQSHYLSIFKESL